ncbi:hypothetical protein DN752_19235 [Echinicola strongylocentroti]|uniref:Uncharacterized protein n=1 Tax=Echinicola strongylocentroti TaxID=1795355 RepID=A0A2Z4IN81_9BACT|nr:hypothetical protein [Echinicola strongylocentroti]AWW32098.1 hypothetical protein DN752_19235 [Echinicola strongylocentroti]
MNMAPRNIISILVGLTVGNAINMGLVMNSGMFVSFPAEMDLTTMENLKMALPLFEIRHFLIPFIAHAISTLAGSLLTALIAVSHKISYALIVGFCFMIGGMITIILLPLPAWFGILDIGLAYMPFAYLGWRLAVKGSPTD